MYSKLIAGLLVGACSLAAQANCGTTSLSLLTSVSGTEQSFPMTCGSDSKWHHYLNVQGPAQFRLKDAQNTFWGDTQPDGTLDTAGSLINVGATVEVIVDYPTKTYTFESTWKRTVIFMQGQTSSGQDMFVRGGIDHTYAQNTLGLTCTAQNYLCAVPIKHRNMKNTTTFPWKLNDNYLDWYGVEINQSNAAQGSAMDWTTNLWPTSWGTKRTVSGDGYGETPLNTWGDHYWMLDVDVDCSKTVNGWFELKSFISNGPGWEGNVSQTGTPYTSGNHFAQCGKINKFQRNSSSVTIQDLPAVTDTTVLPNGMVFCETGSSCLTQTPIVTLCAGTTTNCAIAKSTTVKLQVNNKTVNLMDVLLNSANEFTFNSNSNLISRSGSFVHVEGVGQFVLRVGAGVDITSLTYYNQPINWSGDTLVNFNAETVKRTNGFITLIWHPLANLGTTPQVVATTAQQIYQQEVAVTGIVPPLYRAFFSPADVNPLGGDGSFALGDGTVFMNYANPPWWAYMNRTPLQMMAHVFAHEHQHTIFAARNMYNLVSNDGCLNEGLSDGLGNHLGYVPDSILSAKDGSNYATEGCQVATSTHGKGDCVFWHLKQGGYFSDTTFFNLYHPSRNYALDSCSMTSRTTGNKFVVYLSEATGVDMASFVVGTLKIPAAASLSQAKAELGIQ